jgi:hypothetical protein
MTTNVSADRGRAVQGADVISTLTATHARPAALANSLMRDRGRSARVGAGACAAVPALLTRRAPPWLSRRQAGRRFRYPYVTRKSLAACAHAAAQAQQATDHRFHEPLGPFFAIRIGPDLGTHLGAERSGRSRNTTAAAVLPHQHGGRDLRRRGSHPHQIRMGTGRGVTTSHTKTLVVITPRFPLSAS